MPHQPPLLRTVNITRYVTPLREGGSLPAIAEADDEFLYVIKFHGAGQGTKALVADLVGGELARAAGFRMPELVFANLDEAFGRTEPDEEIQDLLRASVGLNLGVHYLSGSITYDPAVTVIDAVLASEIVWLDAFLTNVDRTARNTNMLTWHKDLWLIDHGACLYFHHNWDSWQEQALKPFALIKNHVLLPQANELKKADAKMKSILTPAVIRTVTDLIPDSWLQSGDSEQSPAERREVYYQFLTSRIQHSAIFVNEANHARDSVI
jgi:hypothetical protein